MVPTQLFQCLITISVHTTYIRPGATFTVIIGWVRISHKKFSEGKQAHVGMEALKTNQTRWESMTPQHFHTPQRSHSIES